MRSGFLQHKSEPWQRNSAVLLFRSLCLTAISLLRADNLVMNHTDTNLIFLLFWSRWSLGTNETIETHSVRLLITSQSQIIVHKESSLFLLLTSVPIVVYEGSSLFVIHGQTLLQRFLIVIWASDQWLHRHLKNDNSFVTYDLWTISTGQAPSGLKILICGGSVVHRVFLTTHICKTFKIIFLLLKFWVTSSLGWEPRWISCNLRLVIVNYLQQLFRHVVDKIPWFSFELQ